MTGMKLNNIGEMNKEPEFVNIKSLLSDETRYVIPLFQRDYAWGIKEVHQLIEDIAISRYNNENKRYHIGSIVLNQDSNCCDVIDGQQRLTTLHLINAYLNKEISDAKQAITNCNLNFCDLRPDYNRCMEVIYQGKLDAIDDNEKKKLPESLMNIYNAIPTIFKEVTHKYNNLKESELAEYIMNQVVALRVFVPPGTDLNHYFRVMNMRGEQLEKHEILKAILISELDEKKHDDFAKLWDKSSEFFSKQAIDSERLAPEPDGDLRQSQNEHKSLKSILSPENLHKFSQKLSTFPQRKKEPTFEFHKSRLLHVVDFPNFLMIVLKIFVEKCISENNSRKDIYYEYLKDINIPLNDDLLIDKFNEVFPPESKHNSKLICDFATLMQELAARVKKYIIHNSNGDWVIGFDSANSASQSPYMCLIALQSMFHTSSPSKKYKYWLYYVLKEENEVKLANYTYWEDLARIYLIGRYCSGDIISYDCFTFDDLLGHHKKVDMDKLKYGQPLLFPLKLYDYLLWKEKLEEGKLKGSDSMHSLGKSLIFSSDQNSVEHFYPQKPSQSPELPPDILDQFGNLCLITSSMNSRFNNLKPQAKIIEYKNQPHKSIKLSDMMENNNWTVDLKEDPPLKNVINTITESTEIAKQKFDSFINNTKYPISLLGTSYELQCP